MKSLFAVLFFSLLGGGKAQIRMMPVTDPAARKPGVSKAIARIRQQQMDENRLRLAETIFAKNGAEFRV